MAGRPRAYISILLGAHIVRGSRVIVKLGIGWSAGQRRLKSLSVWSALYLHLPLMIVA
jgi:hypothetical protein